MSSKKKKKNKKNTTKNKTNKINELDPKTEKTLNNLIKNQSIRKEKKIWFWLILFAPVGIYKAFKYKAFNKSTTIVMLSLTIITLILGVDNILYPNRVIDSKIEKVIENYQDIGDIRSYIKKENLDDTFLIYNVVTTKGEYDIYFSGDGKLSIECINEISPKKEMIYKSDNFPKEYENIYAEIISFFNEEDVANKYGNITGYEDSDLENHQIIITDKGKYSINVEYGQVVSVFTIKEDGALEKSMQRNAEITLPNDISKALNRNEKTIGSVKEVYAYKITNETIEYYFINDKNTHYKIVKYLDGRMEIFLGSSNINQDTIFSTEETEE